MTFDKVMELQRTRTCPVCGRHFDLWDGDQAQEFYAGHDCEC